MLARIVPMRPDVLFARRLAGRALELALVHLGVDEISVRFVADDPHVILPLPDGGLAFAQDWRRPSGEGLAVVYLKVDQEPPAARVVIRRLAQLIRPPHRSEFDPASVGCVRDGRENDVDLELALDELLASEGSLLAGQPQRMMDPSRHHRQPVVHRALKGVMG